MEILLELLFAVLQVAGELLLQIVVEGLVELGLHGVGERLRPRKPLHPLLAAVGYAVLGAAAGAISLWLFPQRFIDTPWVARQRPPHARRRPPHVRQRRSAAP